MTALGRTGRTGSAMVAGTREALQHDCFGPLRSLEMGQSKAWVLADLRGESPCRFVTLRSFPCRRIRSMHVSCSPNGWRRFSDIGPTMVFDD